MMLAAILVAMQPAPPSDEIIVLARRLGEAQLGYRLGRRDGQVYVKSCALSKSSGDAEADAIGCAAVESCAAQNIRNRRQFDTCIKDRSLEMLEQLVDRRQSMRDEP